MILGIDPGSKGGLAVLSESGELIGYARMVAIHDFPDLSSIKKCFIEKCQSRPGQSIQSMFNYGVHFGEILGLLAAHKIPHVLINPRRWQAKIIGKFNKGESKKAALNKAKQLWPTETFVPVGCKKPNDGIVDACLIAEYGRLYG